MNIQNLLMKLWFKKAKFGEVWQIFFLLKENEMPGYKALDLLTQALY